MTDTPTPRTDRPSSSPSGLVYHGLHQPGGGRVVVVETAAGAPLGLLAHRVRHSPDGFSWGYGGSGPAELARCLLLTAAGDDARCPTCAGAGHVELHDDGTEHPATTDSDPEQVAGCTDCDEGSLITPAIYQRFKFDVVAALPDEWRLPRVDVQAWWAAHAATGLTR